MSLLSRIYGITSLKTVCGLQDNISKTYSANRRYRAYCFYSELEDPTIFYLFYSSLCP